MRPEPCDFADPPEERIGIELLTFWSEDEHENRALEVLRNRARSSEVKLGYSETSDVDRSSLQRNLQEGNSNVLPDVFQVNGGSDVLQYVRDKAGEQICDLDRLLTRYEATGRYFDSALASSRCNGAHYAWPISVHRLNTLLINVDVYDQIKDHAEELGVRLTSIEAMTTADQLLEFLELVQSWQLTSTTGEALVPLSLGIQYRNPDLPDQISGQEWALQVVALENFLVSYGRDAYERVWLQREGIEERDLRAHVERLAGHLERIGALVRAQPQSWQDAARAVGEGAALLTIGGDWMRAQVDERALERGVILNLPFPGTADAFVYTPDSFAVPKQVESDGAAVHRWLRQVVDDAPTQIDFARRKQAIPARSDLSKSDIEALDSSYLIDSYEQFSACHTSRDSCRLLLAVSGLGPASNVDPCFDRLGTVIARLASMEFVPRAFGAGTPSCERSMPDSIEDAKEELVTVLRNHVMHPFRGECRSETVAP